MEGDREESSGQSWERKSNTPFLKGKKIVLF